MQALCGEAVTRRHQRLKRMLIEEFGGGCAVCGYDRTPNNLHFHHVDPSTKSFSMHMGVGKAIATFRAEAKKCVLVCANCHGEIEAGLIQARRRGACTERRPRLLWTGPHGVVVSTPAFHAGSGSSTLPGGTSAPVAAAQNTDRSSPPSTATVSPVT